MYFAYFIAYIGIGFGLTLVVFSWAVRNGQFQDQRRARFLPLEPVDAARDRACGGRWKRMEIYTLFFLACAGLLSSGAVLVFALTMGG